MDNQIVLLESDIGKLIATPSGIWLCKGDNAVSVSWEEVAAAQQSVQSDGARCARCGMSRETHDDYVGKHKFVEPPRR